MKRLAALTLSCALVSPIYAQTVATVNGKAITQQQLDSFVNLLVEQGNTDTPELRTKAKQELTDRLAMAQAAEKAGLDKKADIKEAIELSRQGILINALFADYVKKTPVTDADIQKEYDSFKAEMDKEQEYKVRHILVKEEQEAKDLLAKIASKKVKFEDAAKKDSIDTGSGAEGGDLGWSSSKRYVPEFADAVENMKKGELAKAPVQSQFGWHIIEVEDTRPVSVPELNAVKEEIKNMLTQQKLAQYQQKILSDAKIQ